MALLSSADQDRLRAAFGELTRRVRLLFFTQTIGCDTCPMTREILDELPALSDRIEIEEVNLVLDAEKAMQYGVDRAPAVALVSVDDAGVVQDSRIRFLGAPAGYEFSSLVQAVRLVGGRPSGLSAEIQQRLSAVDKPVVMQVFTTPT
jgi:alkyl hydroperoxide reductase subunit AhpF